MRQLRSHPKRSSDVTRQAPLGANCIPTKLEWGTNRPDMYKRCCVLKECDDKLKLKVTDAPSTVLPGTMVHYSAGGNQATSATSCSIRRKSNMPQIMSGRPTMV